MTPSAILVLFNLYSKCTVYIPYYVVTKRVYEH